MSVGRRRAATSHPESQQERKKARELRIGEKFCAALPYDMAVIDQPDSPDLRVQHGDQVIGVELCGYRQQGPENERYEADARFKQRVHDSWLYDEVASGFSLHLTYLKTNGLAQVPREGETDGVIEGLRQLVVQLALGRQGDIHVTFTPGGQPTVTVHANDFRTGLFPRLAQHFRSLRITPHPGIRLGLPSTSLNTAFSGLDEEELRRLLQKKRRRVGSYAKKTVPLWLVIHNDGSPLSSNIPEPLFPKALSIAKGEMKDAGFDRVYWFKDSLRVTGGDLIHVL